VKLYRVLASFNRSSTEPSCPTTGVSVYSNKRFYKLKYLFIEEDSTTGRLTIVTPLKCLVLGQFVDLLPASLFVKCVERHTLDVRGSVHHNTSLIEMTNKIQPYRQFITPVFRDCSTCF
jgi:hypothetical protein